MNVRSVYELVSAFDVKDYKISAIDTNDNVVVLGDKKGYIFTHNEEMRGGSGSQSQFSLTNSTKRASQEINQILFLRRCMMIALLCNNVISIVEFNELKSIQEIKTRKVHMFCVNNAVYQDQSFSGRKS